jgi:two-component system sensor histidine kinase KdpD
VERVVSATRRREASSSIELDLPADIPMIAADAILIEQALSNVVNNAVSHTPQGTRVVVDTRIRSEAVTLCVTDDGPGIPADVLPRIFEKFVRSHRADASKAERGEGTGLGLAIAKGIMEAHGGSIAAESPIAENRGARITLTFPREQPR